MSTSRTVPPVALIVLCPHSASVSAGADRLVRMLAERRLASTWAVEQPAQAAALRSSRPSATIEMAMLLDGDAVESAARRLAGFAAAGESVEAVYAVAPLPRGAVERRFRQEGVSALINPPSAAATASVRALPFGLWSITPNIAAPPARRWLSLFCRRPQDLADLPDASGAVACICLVQAASNSRAWHAIERLADQAAHFAISGGARIVTVAQLAAEHSATHTARPQQSILKMAA